MIEQEKKQQRIYDLLNAETKPKIFRNDWNFFFGFHQAETLTPLITLSGTF